MISTSTSSGSVTVSINSVISCVSLSHDCKSVYTVSHGKREEEEERERAKNNNYYF